jgi:hypothetical protein
MPTLKRFELQTTDGEKADCIEIDRYPYKNGHFSSGLVRGLSDGDTIYIQNHRVADRTLTWFIRPDEAMAIIAGLGRALWMVSKIKRKSYKSKGRRP